MRREEKKRGLPPHKMQFIKCYTFKGACRVWWSADKAREEAAGKQVRRFDCEADAVQWLFAMGV